MTEIESSGIELFKQISDFWKTDSNREGLSPLAVKNIQKVVEYSQTPEGSQAINERAKQLDEAIKRFNEIRRSRQFEGPNEKESKRLSEEILTKDARFPLLSETPLDTNSITPYLVGFKRLLTTNIHYYTFLDKKEAVTQEDMNSLITGILVDGYAGFAFRGRKAAEGQPSKVGRADLTAVNTICEMVGPGELQTEMFKANWYKPDYGLSPEFCNQIRIQFTPIQTT